VKGRWRSGAFNTGKRPLWVSVAFQAAVLVPVVVVVAALAVVYYFFVA